MKIERKITFTNDEEAAVDKVVDMLKELVEEQEIFSVCVDYNPAQDIMLEELYGIMIDFRSFVGCSLEWRIVD